MAQLTTKQAAFVDEYLVDFNATQAAIRAGYSSRTASAIGHENLNKPKIAEALERAIKARSERTKITADRVLEELAAVGLSNLSDALRWDEEDVSFVPSEELDRRTASAIAAVKAKRRTIVDERGNPVERILEVEMRMYDKISALREAGKHLGITEKIDLGGAAKVLVVPAKSRSTEAWERTFGGSAGDDADDS